jgi:hypothetical protein
VDKKYQIRIVDVSLNSDGNTKNEIIEPVACDFIEFNNYIFKEVETFDLFIF